MSDWRAVVSLRGRIVRSLVEHAGTARTEEYITAMAEAHTFNRRHPDLAIPRPFAILGVHPPYCRECNGEGSQAKAIEADGSVPLASLSAVGEVTCGPCGGSGFVGVFGIGERARRAAAPHQR